MKIALLVSSFNLANLAISIVLGLARSPKCASSCWENSKYVSDCEQDTTCLCDDANFQNVVLQCLYSQCQTAQFAVALHHAISECFEASPVSVPALPPLIRYKVKRGEATTLSTGPIHSASASAGATPRIGDRRFALHSASANPKPTRSVNSVPTHSHAIQSSTTENSTQTSKGKPQTVHY